MAQHQARKRFGQNFLEDEAIIDQIIRAIGPRPVDNMVEIGPGLSALTRPLTQALERYLDTQLADAAARAKAVVYTCGPEGMMRRVAEIAGSRGIARVLVEERSGGSWKPSPGSVYPTVQQLEDEGLVEATEAEGRRTLRLSEAGREYVDAHPDELASFTAGTAVIRCRGGRFVAPGVGVIVVALGAFFRFTPTLSRRTGSRMPSWDLPALASPR